VDKKTAIIDAFWSTFFVMSMGVRRGGQEGALAPLGCPK